MSHGRALALVLLAGAAQAELPPAAYREMQARAPEVLEGRVEELSQQLDTWGVLSGPRTVRAQVLVDEVPRSASGQKPGAFLALRYRHEPLPGDAAGPSPIPVLPLGARVRLYLEPDGAGGWRPAARGRSFEVLEPPPPDAKTPWPTPGFGALGLGVLLLGLGISAGVKLRRRP